MRRERLVSTQTLRAGLAELEERSRAEAPYLPDYSAKLVERTLLEFRRLLREAEAEYVSTGAASDLTGWDSATLRKYARLALEGAPLPAEWESLVARREGREFALVLSTIPAKAERRVA